LTYIPDLAPCDYFSFFEIERVRAVGWLDAFHRFPKGSVPRGTLRRLAALRKWARSDSMGVHLCELCPVTVHDATGIIGRWHACRARSGANVFVPGQGVVYAAPVLILHYIRSHDYLPPPEFLAATKACPLARVPYYRAIIENGPDTFRLYFGDQVAT